MENSSELSNFQKDYIACAYLFSASQARDRKFISHLDISALKKAFREKARRYHPDLNPGDSSEMIRKRQERFVKIKDAYDHLFKRIRQKNPGMHVPSGTAEAVRPEKPKIIAVGGAKGGIGKSILASNLSVYLSQKGFRTVAVDLDLGGANLHLFLGKPRIKCSINRFLDNKVSGIHALMERSKYGPLLIGGNSSKLGAANISFTQKLKLLRAIRSLEADYIILDLGGDTSYNVVDFFLAADFGIVMTTCDPASYLDAYSFIKAALYRKLNRLHGPEAIGKGPVDPVLRRLIHETTVSGNNPLVGDPESLISRINMEHPASLDLIRQVLHEFCPQIVVNKVNNEKEALAPVKRIQEVALKRMSVRIGYLCAMPYEAGVEKSARTLIPWMSDDPDKTLVKKMDIIAKGVFKASCRAS